MKLKKKIYIYSQNGEEYGAKLIYKKPIRNLEYHRKGGQKILEDHRKRKQKELGRS